MVKSELKDKIQLTNDGRLQLFFVGTGSAFNKVNFQTNLLVIKGKDHLLIDCGTICPYALSTYNTPISQIQNVLPTHSHADHIGGLEEMALAGRYIAGNKPKIIITDEYKKLLWENSLKGGCTFGEESAKGKFFTFEDYFQQIKPVELKNTPRPVYEANCGSINVKLIRTLHINCGTNDWNKTFYSVGVLIDNRVFFSGDTLFDKPLLDMLEETYKPETYFHDCQFYEGGVHASFKELCTLPESIKNKMFLCHYGENFKDFKPENKGFAGFAERGIYYNF